MDKRELNEIINREVVDIRGKIEVRLIDYLIEKCIINDESPKFQLDENILAKRISPPIELGSNENGLYYIFFASGTKAYFKSNNLHKQDGPAVEWANGNKAWYYEGYRIDCNSTEEFIGIILPLLLTNKKAHITLSKDNIKIYNSDGLLEIIRK